MSDKWLKAATIGSIWASIEIIIGSFLHNLRLPLAGSVLSFFAVVLMVSFIRLWPQRGIILRAGLICALMKSISPSAVILGPMTGIMLEALLMELGMLVLGVNLAGMILGGMLGVLSALFHKAVNLLIVYGTDLAGLLNQLVIYSAKQLKTDAVTGSDLLIILASIYLVAGALAAITGWRLSVKTDSGRAGQPDLTFGRTEPSNRLFGYSERQSYSVFLLAGHLLGLILLLVAMNRYRLEFWIVPVSIYLIFSMLRYKRALRQLLRPKFWFQMVVITFISTVFLQSVATRHWFDRSGFEAGILMNIRAMMVLTAFTAISTELKNPLVKTLIFRRGLSDLYKSVSLAFSVLPGILEMNPDHGRKAGQPVHFKFRQVISGYLMKANDILEQFKHLESMLPDIQIIIGDRESGKTTFLQGMVESLTAGGKKVSGFLAIGVHDAEGLRTGFRIRNIETGEETEFCDAGGNPEWEGIGRFRINPEGLARGYEWLSTDHIRNCDVVVIDELGPLELGGKGWSGLIDRILTDSPKPMIWTARISLAKKLSVKWNVGKVTFIDLSLQKKPEYES